MAEPSLIPLLLTTVEAGATIAFALSGLLEAARKRLDAVGRVHGGGAGGLRRRHAARRAARPPALLLGRARHLAVVLLALCIGAMALLRARHFAPTERAMQWPDALGLGLFSAGGTQIALAQGLPAIVAVLMGVITATFGGVLRDIVCNELPRAFSDHRPYAVCAFAGGWVLVGAQATGLPEAWGVLAAAATASGLRALALATDYRLPGWSAADGPLR